MNHLFISVSNSFSARGKLQITETADTESVDMEARLYKLTEGAQKKHSIALQYYYSGVN
jgi:hypothetical protein